MLPHVCDNSKQFNKFVSGKNSFLGAYEKLEEDGKTKDLVVQLKTIQKQLASMNKSEFDGLDSRATTDARYMLKRIKTQTENLFNKSIWREIVIYNRQHTFKESIHMFLLADFVVKIKENRNPATGISENG